MTLSFSCSIVEDHLSAAVVEKIFQVHGVSAGDFLGLQGIGYIRSKIKNFNESAKNLKIFALVDLDDKQQCPIDLIKSFVKGPINRGLLFRIAVVEIESWVLADPVSLSKFLKVSPTAIPTRPDSLESPKEALVAVAKKSRSRSIISGMIPEVGGTAIVGKEYNALMAKFVKEFWDPNVAKNNSPSLCRAIESILKFVSDHAV